MTIPASSKLFLAGMLGVAVGVSGSHFFMHTASPAHDMASMEGSMDAMESNLSGKTADAFDQAFLSEMIVHHQGALDMARLAEAGAKHEEIRELAGRIIASQTPEIALMRQWQDTWYQK